MADWLRASSLRYARRDVPGASVTQRLTQISVAAGGTAGGTAPCASGEVLVGGGFADQSHVVIYNSSPSGSNGWEAYLYNPNASSNLLNVYAMCLARAHRMGEADLRDLEYGVILHDIGKIGIPDSILLKPGPLTPEEWKVMRTHPEVGRRLVENIPFLAGAVPIVYHHHERWDGHGYPEGLSGESIPLGARIFAVADALDAMTYDRPYSRAVTLEAARAEISRCAGTHFDPAVVDSFMTIPPSTLEELRRRATS